jgi:hypothetical protein
MSFPAEIVLTWGAELAADVASEHVPAPPAVDGAVEPLPAAVPPELEELEQPAAATRRPVVASATPANRKWCDTGFIV